MELSYSAIASEIRQHVGLKTWVIGVDGPGGAGKTTFAQQLAEAVAAEVVHMDDFYRHDPPNSDAHEPWGSRFDWRRLKKQVLDPLVEGEPARYQRYDWSTQALAEWHTIASGGVVIVEGVCSLRPELRTSYGLAIWIDCPRGTRLQRGVQRDGPGSQEQWEEVWMPAEDRYIAGCRPDRCADIVVDGSRGGVGYFETTRSRPPWVVRPNHG